MSTLERLKGRRLSIFPIRDKTAFNMYKQHQAVFWTAEEIDLAEDMRDLKKLKSEEREFLFKILAFFNSSDIIVNANIDESWMLEPSLQAPEIKFFLQFQMSIENTHSETYSLLIDTYCNAKEKEKYFNAVERIPSVRAKAQWVTKYMNRQRPLVERLFAFVLVEGLQFSGSFASLFWFKKRGLMPGLTFSNELISRDEGLHATFTAMLFKRENEKLKNEDKFTQTQAYEIVHDCVRIETQFMCDALKVRLIGMNDQSMTQYIKFVADYWLMECGFEPLYKTTNPFVFMEMISLSAKTNFFEKRVSDYNKANVGTTREEREFSMDHAF